MVTHNARRRSAGEAEPVEATTAGLVTLWRTQPVRAGGPVRAEVAFTEVDDWLARGWQRQDGSEDTDGA